MRAIFNEETGYGSLTKVSEQLTQSKSTLSEWCRGQISPQLSTLSMPEIGWSTQDFINALASDEDPVSIVQRKKKETKYVHNRLSLDEEEVHLYQFQYQEISRLKKLMVASQRKLLMSREQYLQSAMSRGITREEAIYFYEDVMEEQLASHPISRISAFLPLLFKVSGWKPLILKDNTYTSVEELLKHLNNFSVGSTV